MPYLCDRPYLLDEWDGDDHGGAALVSVLLLPALLHGPLVVTSVRLGVVVAASGHLSSASSCTLYYPGRLKDGWVSDQMGSSDEHGATSDVSDLIGVQPERGEMS